MADPESTPTKVNSRVVISPSSKNKICVLCCASIVKADIRRKLFGPSSEKTKACLSLELLLGVEIDKTLLLTEIICRNCYDRNETLVKKIVAVRERFASTRTKLVSEKSTAYTKRMARKSLFENDCGDEEPYHTKTLKTRSSSTCTTEQDPGFLSSVEVRNILLFVLVKFFQRVETQNIILLFSKLQIRQ